MATRRARRTARLAILTLVALAAIPILSGRPLASYPVSNSMVPTIGPYDVFFVNPYPADVRVGDIIVFDSLTHGGSAVHRVVGIEDGGFVTQGDANPNIDQIGAEPLVTRERVLGRVLTNWNGDPILIPRAGAPIIEARNDYLKIAGQAGGEQKLTSMLLLATGLLLAIPAFLWKTRQAPSIASRRVRKALRRAFPRGILGKHVAIAMLLLILTTSAWAAVRAKTDVETGVIVLREASASDGARAVAPGEVVTRDIQIEGVGPFPTIAFLEPGTQGVRAEGAHGRIDALGNTRLSTQLVAGPVVGAQLDIVEVWRYPIFMPESWITTLHRAVPGSPYLAFGGGLALVGALWFASLRIAKRPVGTWIGIREGWL